MVNFQMVLIVFGDLAVFCVEKIQEVPVAQGFPAI
jgi:hypothetical protein